MVAFNFMKQFAPGVRSGKKKQTIRSKQRCKVGDHVQLYTGQRTKQCQLIATSVCVGVYPIQITEGGMNYNKKVSLTVMAKRDGFRSPVDMLNFFRHRYGLPYDGWVHVWR